jgi:serine/threonine-protein kinase
MLQPGQTFAHFRIIKLLGKGGMGEVYLAEDQKLKRQVALKILLTDYFEDGEHLARFEREARTAARIQNRYVMAIRDYRNRRRPQASRPPDQLVVGRSGI